MTQPIDKVARSQTIQPLPPIDFCGHGPTLHLAHANGFPPGTYRQLANALTSDYHVIALPSRALWPGSRQAGPT